MSIFDKFKVSNAWSPTYNLPLVPQHNNPFLYCAYAFKLMGTANYEGVSSKQVDLYKYARLCELKPGLYSRKPDRSGGIISHDELIGIAWFSPVLAYKVLKYLKGHCGWYQDQGASNPLRYNLYRFPWFISYLKARSFEKLNIFDKFVFTAHLWLDEKFYKGGDEGGRLMIWIMLDDMERHVPSAVAAWRNAMHAKGMSPKKCFEKYLSECPVYHELASERF